METRLAEPDLSFHYAVLRLQWADKKIGEFIKLHNHICDQHPVQFSVLQDDDGTLKLGTLPSDVIPGELPLLAGDLIHDLRCALDYCWMGLQRAAFGPDAKKTTIPRGDNRKEVEGTVNKASLKDAFPDVTEFICDKARLYESGNKVLWLIGKLDNWHKHNLLVAVMHRSTINSLFLKSPSGRVVNIKGGAKLGGEASIKVHTSPGDEFKAQGESVSNLEVMIGCRTVKKAYSAIPLMTTALQDTSDLINAFIDTYGSV